MAAFNPWVFPKTILLNSIFLLPCSVTMYCFAFFHWWLAQINLSYILCRAKSNFYANFSISYDLCFKRLLDKVGRSCSLIWDGAHFLKDGFSSSEAFQDLINTRPASKCQCFTRLEQIMDWCVIFWNLLK